MFLECMTNENYLATEMTQTSTSILQPNTATRVLPIKGVTSAHFEK